MSTVVILRSLPRYCPICKADEQVDLYRTDGTFVARIPCPHCTGTPELHALIANPGAPA